MALGFRKGLKFGPFRMTLSKSGPSLSIGAGGARVTAGPRGTHFNFWKGGFYYRTRLDKPPSKDPFRPTARLDGSAPVNSHPDAPPQVQQSKPSEDFVDAACSDTVTAMNRRLKRSDYSIVIGIAISAIIAAFSVPLPIVFLIGAASGFVATLLYRRSRRTTLLYENDAETLRRLEHFHKALAALRLADSVWVVREASLSNGLTAHPPTLRRTKIAKDSPILPQYVRTNITPPALQLPDSAFYFFPDRLYIWHLTHFAAVEYADLKFQFRRVTFLERESQPADAVVESRIRRSLTGQDTFPVLYYGLADINSTHVLQVSLLVSRLESAEEFVRFLQLATGATTSPEPNTGSTKENYTHFDPVRVPLFYSLSDAAFKRFQDYRSAFELISNCDCVWLCESEENADWKRDAGDRVSVTRTRIHPSVLDHASGFESNIAFGLSFGDSALFVLPDALLTLTGRRFQNIGTHACCQSSENVVF